MWGFRYTCYVATATQNLKDFRNSSLWTCSLLMAISRIENVYRLFDDFSLFVSLSAVDSGHT